MPLVEVVTAPELRSAEEAAEFMRALRALVRWLGISEGDMEKGQMRCDANVVGAPARRGSARHAAELKNINSFRFVQNAVEHEIARQVRAARRRRSRRAGDAAVGRRPGHLAPMRSKEEANDYRYFPDPDLPPLVVDGAMMAAHRARCPSCRMARCARYPVEHGLSPDDARVLIADRALADYFDERRGEAARRAKHGRELDRSELLASSSDDRRSRVPRPAERSPS